MNAHDPLQLQEELLLLVMQLLVAALQSLLQLLARGGQVVPLGLHTDKPRVDGVPRRVPLGAVARRPLLALHRSAATPQVGEEAPACADKRCLVRPGLTWPSLCPHALGQERKRLRPRSRRQYARRGALVLVSTRSVYSSGADSTREL
ncbi:Lipoxygenase LoxA [Frankliniella fusca]|uniref:Lipoxygenase LoxA n=1 Tax=Frankliniella fusca TaxID=407009 RepID=A0AAE1HCE9_9NEOP|nr:Lipoxygenase LoxA [Frankliniella fusca]